MEFIFIIAILIMSVVVHEVSHGYAALALGDHTARLANRLTLNPIRHLDPVGSVIVPALGYFLGGFIIGWAKPVPFNPYNLKDQRWGEAIVAVAGPASNIAIALIFGLIMRFGSGLSFMNESVFGILTFVVFINIVLAFFNLIPIPPLDGSKILFSILPYRFNYIRQTIERFGLILVLIFIFAVWQFLFPIITSIFTLITGFAM